MKKSSLIKKKKAYFSSESSAGQGQRIHMKIKPYFLRKITVKY